MMSSDSTNAVERVEVRASVIEEKRSVIIVKERESEGEGLGEGRRVRAQIEDYKIG